MWGRHAGRRAPAIAKARLAAAVASIGMAAIGCDGASLTAQSAPPDTWTVMVYMGGDNTLVAEDHAGNFGFATVQGVAVR